MSSFVLFVTHSISSANTHACSYSRSRTSQTKGHCLFSPLVFVSHQHLPSNCKVSCSLSSFLVFTPHRTSAIGSCFHPFFFPPFHSSILPSLSVSVPRGSRTLSPLVPSLIATNHTTTYIRHHGNGHHSYIKITTATTTSRATDSLPVIFTSRSLYSYRFFNTNTTPLDNVSAPFPFRRLYSTRSSPQPFLPTVMDVCRCPSFRPPLCPIHVLLFPFVVPFSPLGREQSLKWCTCPPLSLFHC